MVKGGREHHQRADAAIRHRAESWRELLDAPHRHFYHVEIELRSSGLQLPQLAQLPLDPRVPENGDAPCVRPGLVEQFETLGRQLRRQQRQARGIAAGPRETGDEPCGDWITDADEDYGKMRRAGQAACAAAGAVDATITSTFCATRSATSAGSRAASPSASRISMVTFCSSI